MPLSKSARPDAPEAIFVDEGRCIGCQACVFEAPNTFAMEASYNRARVETQWGDSVDDIDTAIASCPKDCIYSVATVRHNTDFPLFCLNGH